MRRINDDLDTRRREESLAARQGVALERDEETGRYRPSDSN